jgi:hypothetical protein
MSPGREEPTDEQLRRVASALQGRRGFRQVFDEITFHDDHESEDDEWTPVQREVLVDLWKAAR